MHLKTLLGRIHPVKPFVHEDITFVKAPSQPNGARIELRVRDRKGHVAVCLGCGRRAPVHDRPAVRRFDLVPLWGILVVLLYALRRVDLPPIDRPTRYERAA